MKPKNIVVIFFILLTFLMTGCVNAVDTTLSTEPTILLTEQPTTPASETPNITLTLVPNEDGARIYRYLTEEDLDGIYNGSINFSAYLNVLIDINGESMPIREAILDKHITVEEFIAGIRTDARNGFCVESYESELGLTYFLYTYSNFEVAIFDDVWEAPNGESFLVRDIYIDKKDGFISEAIGRYYTNDEGQEINYKREDWGLSFEVIDATPSNVRIKATQTDGQQFGQLQIRGRVIISSSNSIPGTAFNTQPYISVSPAEGSFTMEGISEFTFDWSEDIGELPSGTYSIAFMVEDIYDTEALHPFTKNYTDLQFYYFEFEIP